MNKVLTVALGVLTSVGGYLEAGSIGTTLAAGARFRFSLLWAIVLGTVCIAFLIEMSGRLAAVSHHTLADAMRERFGIRYQVVPLGAQLLLDLLVLAAEIGGAAFALQLVTGVSFRLWAPLVALLVWMLLWLGTFGTIENGVSLLGLVTLSFVAAAYLLHPPAQALIAGLRPTLPADDRVSYLYLAVSIIGATVSPYLITFYSSGAIEDDWDPSLLVTNRIVAALGMGFGALIAIGVLITAAMVLAPAHITVESFADAANVMTTVFPQWGRGLFAASLFIGCVGAALEIGLDGAYILAQSAGWNWGENQRPAEGARFSLTYTGFLALALFIAVIGPDPLTLTMLTMALTAVILPVVVAPLIVLMNDQHYLSEHRNGWVANVAVITVTLVAFVLAAMAIPLQFAGS